MPQLKHSSRICVKVLVRKGEQLIQVPVGILQVSVRELHDQQKRVRVAVDAEKLAYESA